MTPFNRKVQNLIADFRGLPPDESRMIDKGTKSMDTLLEVVIQRYRIGEARPEERILEVWPRIIGEAYAQRCTPVRLTTNGELVISINNPVLRREILFGKRRILQKVRALPGCSHVNNLIFTH